MVVAGPKGANDMCFYELILNAILIDLYVPGKETIHFGFWRCHTIACTVCNVEVGDKKMSVELV